MPAPPVIVKALIFYIRRIICMPRPHQSLKLLIISAPGVLIAYYKTNGRARSPAVKYARKKFGNIRLGAGSSARPAGRAPAHMRIIFSREISVPAGTPSITAPMAGPCDSPNMLILKHSPIVMLILYPPPNYFNPPLKNGLKPFPRPAFNFFFQIRHALKAVCRDHASLFKYVSSNPARIPNGLLNFYNAPKTPDSFYLRSARPELLPAPAL